MINWCSGRDLDPGRRLERPVYLTGLYYRSAFHNEASTRMLFPSNKPYPSRTILLANRLVGFRFFWGKQKGSYLLDKFGLVCGGFF